ncbi:vacuolar protein sorting-associated protein 51 homolog [Pyrus x bretschneideri]|uniref:vacuolar protein sorting-associated protein 51 homolog n=1 Tax=Pyrus x bretschneideri TaxID=225117 RepID=UPI0020306D91|nr:vacuolar protein sorting-associated protein 51 homolog [Pyrus x bretschneideri]
MEVNDVPLDDKAKRMRDLLSSFYSPDPSLLSSNSKSSSKYATLDAINSTSFDPDQHMHLLVHKSNLEGLLQRHVQMAAEIKNLDTDLQMLVYENYNKFISATDTIKQMKSNIVGMEANMEQVLQKIMSVQSRSDGVNTSLSEKREHVEKLHRTRNLLRKVQFIYDLPARLGKCIKSEAYADVVKFYTGAIPIFKAYGDSSFQDCKRASEEAVTIIIKNLQGKLFSDSESMQARAEAAVLLKQLDFPVDSLKVKLLEKLEQFVAGLQLKIEDIRNASLDSNDPSTDTVPSTAHETSVREFAEYYINMRTQRISVLLKKRFTTPNWVQHKEPREVHMFVDLFLQELEAIRSEVKQILPQGIRRHRRADSNRSTASSRSNPLQEEKLSRSNTQRARSQLLETHLAKLFKQKVEIFTKVDFTQESVVTTLVKLCLKSLQEFVRLQTFNRSGFLQIQLDIQFLKSPSPLSINNRFGLVSVEQVIVAAAERCLDPIPLEPAILDKLTQLKLAKTREQKPISP